ncbi:hypothetical protein BDV93DRAFT_522495 [Ceratobasidium sp. AG-I]|nr:hypothetical protein BDV93DRAFT_522495 [Ceratobasidium sp. AG-I]
MLVDIEHFECLAALPLREVALNLVCLYDPRAAKHENPSFAKEIIALWPNVAMLKLPDQEMTLGSLHYFSALPNLRHLLLKLRSNQGWSVQDSITPVPKNLALHTLRLNTGVTQDFILGRVEEVAK